MGGGGWVVVAVVVVGGGCCHIEKRLDRTGGVRRHCNRQTGTIVNVDAW